MERTFKGTGGDNPVEGFIVVVLKAKSRDASVGGEDARDGLLGVDADAEFFEAVMKGVEESFRAPMEIAHAAFALGYPVDPVPDPGGGNLVVKVAKLQFEEGFPDDLIGLFAESIDEPGLGREFVELGPLFPRTGFQGKESEADTL